MDIGALDTLAFGAITLGRTDTNGVEWYWTGIDGWGAPASTVAITQKAAADGGFASPAYLTARTFTVTFSVLAPTRAALVDALDNANVQASTQPQVITVANGGTTRTVTAQRQGEVMVVETSDVSADVTLVYVAVDPRKVGAASTASATLVTAGSASVSLTSTGKYQGPVTITIVGPVTNPTVTHVGAATASVTISKTITSGTSVTIYMDDHKVIDSAGTDIAEYVTTRGWSGYDPGANTWTLSASAATNAKVTVTAAPAWL